MKNIYINKNIIGADETGVGDYLTPLVAAACFVPIKNIPYLIELGITDSKKLTDKNIKMLFFEIKDKVLYSTSHLTPAGYNKLNVSFNAHELKTIVHLKAISNLENKIEEKLDLVILDKYVNENSFKKYLDHIETSKLDIPFFKTPLKMVEKGEMEHISVASASIIGRFKLLMLMEEQGKKWDTTFPLGTNPRVEEFARNFVKRNGRDKLKEVAKISFKTTKKILT